MRALANKYTQKRTSRQTIFFKSIKSGSNIKGFKKAETRNLQKCLHPVQKRRKQVINYL